MGDTSSVAESVEEMPGAAELAAITLSVAPVVVIREGCPACAQEAKESPGAIVLSMTRSQGGVGGRLNPRANPFPIIEGKQSRRLGWPTIT